MLFRSLISELPHATAEARLRHLFLTALSREPLPTELDRCLAALGAVENTLGNTAAEEQNWTEICHALLGMKEFIYVR